MTKPDSTETVGGNGRGPRTRERILLAAARRFRYSGFATTSLREIAKEAGITAGSIYNHFTSKEQILDEVLHLGIENVASAVQARVAGLPSSASWRNRISAAVREHMLMALHQGDFTSANIRLWGQLPPEVKERQQAVRRAYSDYWRKLFENARSAGELRPDVNPKILELFIVGALSWTGEWYDPRKGSFDVLCDDILSIVFDGIARQDDKAPR
jgi:AcrR family transcriptional regulator